MARGSGTGTVTVKFLGDLADLQKKTLDAGNTVGGFGDNMKKAAGGIAQAFAGLGVATFLKDATEAAAEDQAAHEKLATSLRNSIGAWDGQVNAIEKWITKAQFTKGFSDNDLRTSFAALTEVTHNVSDSQALMGTAMDVARAKGIPLAAAADLMAKAHEGNTKAIKAQFPELGKLISDNASAQEIMAAVTETVKGQADTFAGTAAGKTEIFHQKMGELTESIGAHLLPVLAGLADWLNKIIDWFSGLPGPVQTGTVVVLGIGVALSALTSVLGPVFAALAALGAELGLMLGPVAAVVAVVAALVAGVVLVAKNWDTVTGAAGAVFGWLGHAWDNVTGTVTAPFGVAAGAIRRSFDAVRAGVGAAWNAVAGFLDGLAFTIHVPHIPGTPIGGDYTVGVASLPRFHSGGVVPGVPGADVLAVVQAGERLFPAGAGGRRGGDTYRIDVHALDAESAAEAVINTLREIDRGGAPLPMAL